jgi:hypothetical protein
MELPVIMKWIKQTFAQRYNRLTGRIGHIWGDRYWSAILEGEPPEEEGTGGNARTSGGGGVSATGVRPCSRKRRSGARFPAKSPPPAPNSPG